MNARRSLFHTRIQVENLERWLVTDKAFYLADPWVFIRDIAFTTNTFRIKTWDTCYEESG